MPVKPEPVKMEHERLAPTTAPTESTTASTPIATKRDSKPEHADRGKSESTPTPPLAAPPTVTTKSGRACKPSTPALATFQEAAGSRSRPSRTMTEGAARKSHKKTGSVAAQALIQQVQAADTDASSSMQDDDEGDIDADEPTYCYCNSVSYGEMVACDADGCEREWFHLACVGLKVAPGSKSEFSRTPFPPQLYITCVRFALSVLTRIFYSVAPLSSEMVLRRLQRTLKKRREKDWAIRGTPPPPPSLFPPPPK